MMLHSRAPKVGWVLPDIIGAVVCTRRLGRSASPAGTAWTLLRYGENSPELNVDPRDPPFLIEVSKRAKCEQLDGLVRSEVLGALGVVGGRDRHALGLKMPDDGRERSGF
jgi:hypothetical protein